MSKLLSEITARGINQTVTYHGLGDLATGWEIEEIVKNVAFFAAFYDNYPLSEIVSLDDYITYLFLLKFQAMEEVIPLLQHEDHKEIIRQLAENANAVLSEIKVGDVIRYINNKYEDIFTVEDPLHSIRNATLKLIKRYIPGINVKVFDYLCTNLYYLVIDDFDSFYKVFKENKCLFEKLYPISRLKDSIRYRFEETLNIFSSILSSGHEDLKYLVNKRVELMLADIEGLVTNITDENVFINERIIRKFTSFLQRIKHPKANDFLIYNKKVEEILFKRIKETGSRKEFKIPVGELVDEFSAIEPWIMRLLSLTHQYNVESNPPKIVSHLEYEKSTEKHLIDLCCGTNIPTDDYFTHSHQQKLSISASVHSNVIIGIMGREEAYADLSKLIISALSFVAVQMQREDENLTNDWNLLDRMLRTIIINQELGTEALQPLCYGAAMFTCSLMEKILRLFYVDKVRDRIYVPTEGTTLGQLLTENCEEVTNIFGHAHIKHLAFFMLKNGDKRIGMNYRNRLAHWSDIESSVISVYLVAELLWLFIDVLNTIFVYYIEQLQEPDEINELDGSE